MTGNEYDMKAIEELRAMARVYLNHGFDDKAAKLLALADAMQVRLERMNLPDNTASQVINIRRRHHPR